MDFGHLYDMFAVQGILDLESSLGSLDSLDLLDSDVEVVEEEVEGIADGCRFRTAPDLVVKPSFPGGFRSALG